MPPPREAGGSAPPPAAHASAHPEALDRAPADPSSPPSSGPADPICEVPARALLAVDAGLRCGLAWFGPDGRLQRYRSTHFPKIRDVGPTAWRLLGEVSHLVIEGGGDPAAPWLKAAARRGVQPLQIHAETWRQDLLWPRERRGGRRAKAAADPLARAVIAHSGAPRPTALRHDAAEAILLGLWAVLDLGWLPAPPDLRLP